MFKVASTDERKECIEKISFYKNSKHHDDDETLKNIIKHATKLQEKIDTLTKIQSNFVHGDEIEIVIRDIINHTSANIDNNRYLKQIQELQDKLVTQCEQFF